MLAVVLQQIVLVALQLADFGERYPTLGVLDSAESGGLVWPTPACPPPFRGRDRVAIAYLSMESGDAAGFLPLKGGGQVGVGLSGMLCSWVPAFAGMTMERVVRGLGASLMHPTGPVFAPTKKARRCWRAFLF